MEHQEVFWDEISSCTQGHGLFWNKLKWPRWKHLNWHSGTVHSDRDDTETSPELVHSFLAFPLRFCCCQIQFPVQHFENLLSLAQTCTCAMVFLWNILLKTSWHSIKPHSVFHPSAYFATVAKPGCLLRNSPRKSTFKDDTGGPTVFQKGPFTF